MKDGAIDKGIVRGGIEDAPSSIDPDTDPIMHNHPFVTDKPVGIDVEKLYERRLKARALEGIGEPLRDA